MEPMTLNLSTVIVALIIAVLAFLAIRRIHRRGLCDSGGACDRCSSSGGCGSSGSCASCSAVDKMVADMDRAAKGKR